MSLEGNAALKNNLSIRDFEKIRFLGKGSYARIVLVKQKTNNKVCALKIIPKALMVKEGKETEVKIECEAMLRLDHEGIIKLYNTFDDEENFYLLLEYVPNGSLANLLSIRQVLDFNLAQQYITEIVNILEHMHGKGIAHRDLKPENIMLSEDFHLKLGDFGTAKFTDKEGGEYKELAFVGTPEYVSPEVVLGKDSGPASDLWALGCILYQFFVGTLPFTNKTEFLILDAISKGKYEFPQHIDPNVIDLCQKLLVVDPNKRLGNGSINSPLSYQSLKQHKFFKGIKFDEVLKIKPVISVEVMYKLRSEKKIIKEEELDSLDEEINAEQLEKPSKSPKAKNPNEANIIMKEGIVLKKCGWLFYKKRTLKLTGRPRLSYYDAEDATYKGDIALTGKTKAVKITATKFQIMTANRTYYFEGLTAKDTVQWTEMINTIIDYYYPPNT